MQYYCDNLRQTKTGIASGIRKEQFELIEDVLVFDSLLNNSYYYTLLYFVKFLDFNRNLQSRSDEPDRNA